MCKPCIYEPCKAVKVPPPPERQQRQEEAPRVVDLQQFSVVGDLKLLASPPPRKSKRSCKISATHYSTRGNTVEAIRKLLGSSTHLLLIGAGVRNAAAQQLDQIQPVIEL